MKNPYVLFRFQEYQHRREFTAVLYPRKKQLHFSENFSINEFDAEETIAKITACESIKKDSLRVVLGP